MISLSASLSTTPVLSLSAVVMTSNDKESAAKALVKAIPVFYGGSKANTE